MDMYADLFAPLRAFRCIPLLFPLLLLPMLPAKAAVVVEFDFDDAGGNLDLAPDSIAPGITALPWRDADGTLAGYTGNPGQALGARSWDDGNTLTLTLTTVPGWAWTLAGFSFDQRASATGAHSWSLLVAAAEHAGGVTTQSFATANGAITAGPFSGTVDVALFGSGGTSAAGTWRIDNFVLTGNVSPVPLPSALILLLSSVLGFVGLRFTTPV
jgi:hypothetical protein